MDVQQRVMEELQCSDLGSALGQWMAQHQSKLQELLRGREDS